MAEPAHSPVGVIGAGTMGAGIAQVAAAAGHPVILYDVSATALQKGLAGIRRVLDRSVDKGRLSAEAAGAIGARIATTSDLAALAGADWVIEAAPERLELKTELFRRLGGLLAPTAVLLSNTSSLSITALAAAAGCPERMAGLHFFNPAPLMPLVEVVRGLATPDDLVQAVVDLARSLGKTPVVCHDTPGFIVNRVARPFYAEALRLVGENLAVVPAVDRIVKGGGRFPMGPFELLDLIGVDVNFDVTRAVFAGYHGEPRFRPHPLQQRMVAAGRLGRKTGRGFYHYDGAGAGPVAAAEPAPPACARPEQVAILGDGPLAEDLVRLATAAGHDVRRVTDPGQGGAGVTVAIEALSGGAAQRRAALAAWAATLASDARLYVLCQTAAATELARGLPRPQRVVGYGALVPLAAGHTVELTLPWQHAAGAGKAAGRQAEAFWPSLGLGVEWVADAAGLVLARIVACLANEAAYALSEGVASAADLDTAMRLGTSYPRGPLAWADRIGLDQVLAILAALQAEWGDDRFRPAPLLKQLVRAGHLGVAAGRGFHRYDEEAQTSCPKQSL